MKRSSRSHAHGSTRWQAIATDLLRPSAEAVLLAGVAFGCAQIGWRLVEPASAGIPVAPAQVDIASAGAMARFQSPFAPVARVSDTAVPTAVGSIRLVGVRMAKQQDFSGAVLTFGDDLQRPFLVGQTITEGIQLAQVHADHIVVSFGENEQTIPLTQGNGVPPSFALALMGKATRPDLGVVQQAHMPSTAPAAQTVSLSDGAASLAGTQWLLSTMASVETRNGAPYAWRIASAPPAALGVNGLATGDLILSVNGVGPGDATAVMAAANASRVELSIERASGERASLVLVNGVAS